VDELSLRYSAHAREHLIEYLLGEDEVEAIVWYPSRRFVTADAVEHYGWSSDGREIRVVTDRSETFVITIVDTEHRRRLRRYRR
jgi:hypothetical protein